MFCSNCGKEIEENVLECPHCKAKIKKESVPPKIEILEKIKKAGTDALKSISTISFDPVGKLKEALQILEGPRPMYVGIVFGFLFAIVFTFSILIFFSKAQFSYFYQADIEIKKLKTIIKIFIAAFIPFIGSTLAFSICRIISRGKGSFSSDFFIVGTSLIPMSIAILLSSILGIGNLEVIIVLLVIAFCYYILILFTGFKEINEISSSLASIFVPIIILLSLWIDKVIFTSLLLR